MPIGTNVVHLIFLTEKIEAAALEGQTSPQESLIIEECAAQLVNAVRVPAEWNVDQFLIPFQ